MLGQSVDEIGVPLWDGAERRPERLGWLCRARHPTAPPSPAIFLFRIFIGEKSGADYNSVQQWRARGGLGCTMYEALGKSNVDGARGYSRVTGIGRSTQAQEEGIGADGGVLGP